jgi:hypothetical protein
LVPLPLAGNVEKPKQETGRADARKSMEVSTRTPRKIGNRRLRALQRRTVDLNNPRRFQHGPAYP